MRVDSLLYTGLLLEIHAQNLINLFIMSLQRFEFPMSDDASDTKFECWGVMLPPDGVAVKIKELAAFLGYGDVKKAYKLIPEEWKITWTNLQTKLGPRWPQLVTSSNQTQLPANWHPETLFVLEPGVYALMARSNKPVAKQRMKFVYETILPTIRKTGKYEVKTLQSTSTEVVNYDKKLAEAHMEAMKLKLELSQTVAKYDSQLNEYRLANVEMKRNYEHQMAEFKEREYKMQLQMKDLVNAANMTMTQFAVNALLAKDNIEENSQMRQTLTNVSGRVVPEMTEQPHKEEYITGYERTVNGKRRIRICRSQMHEIEQQDKAIQRYRDESTSSENKRSKPSKRYAWLRESEKFLQLKCPNPVMVWLKVRTDQPHMFYGLRYTNKLKTEMEVLDEAELRAKYKSDTEMCKRNKTIHSKLIEEFKALNLVDEDDCVTRCLTHSVDAKERINAIVEGIVDNMSKELVPTKPQRSHANAGEVYTAEQVVHTMNNCQNYFVKNVFNINYVAAAPPPAGQKALN
ncbi:BRO-A [Helicoverpa armigera granulovirus]|uniref:BRO-A n=1 Tax=Helicoverpa armigera granulovirus TaxID=489830 RepID=A9YMP6_9BBAC|nr:BRO-A [Helicoverpa armigera granulovirus]ABY47745.1 BRO-A [Helicoverpa armigera granulovirus]